jgi:hypothetical protein
MSVHVLHKEMTDEIEADLVVRDLGNALDALASGVNNPRIRRHLLRRGYRDMLNDMLALHAVATRVLTSHAEGDAA